MPEGLRGLRGHERAQLHIFGPFAHATLHRALGASWYGGVGEPAVTVEIHYESGGSLLTSRRASPVAEREQTREHFLRHVAQHVVNERLRTLEDRSPESIVGAVELGHQEHARIDGSRMVPRQATVGNESWLGWEMEIEDIVYLWISMPGYDVYSTGDRAFVSSQISVVALK